MFEWTGAINIHLTGNCALDASKVELRNFQERDHLTLLWGPYRRDLTRQDIHFYTDFGLFYNAFFISREPFSNHLMTETYVTKFKQDINGFEKPFVISKALNQLIKRRCHRRIDTLSKWNGRLPTSKFEAPE